MGVKADTKYQVRSFRYIAETLNELVEEAGGNYQQCVTSAGKVADRPTADKALDRLGHLLQEAASVAVALQIHFKG